MCTRRVSIHSVTGRPACTRPNQICCPATAMFPEAGTTRSTLDRPRLGPIARPQQRPARRAYSPVLRHASLPGDTTVPWWDGRQLRFEFA